MHLVANVCPSVCGVNGLKFSCSLAIRSEITFIKECGKLLQEHPTLFISGVAGIGKSEFAKYYADKNRKKYTNIIYLYYAGDIKKSIAGMEFDDDTSEMTEKTLFDRHYKTLKNCTMTVLLFLIILMYTQRMTAFSRNLHRMIFSY